MPYLALIDQLTRFIRKKSSFLILSGYSFNDGHLNDAIVNALKANPTAMVLGLMYDRYKKEGIDGILVDRYPDAYALAENQHNLNIWTFDKAIIGTNLGVWGPVKNRDDTDREILNYIHTKKMSEDSGVSENIIELGDFSVFTDFLKRIIGSTKDLSDV